jgi:hypothetical protein
VLPRKYLDRNTTTRDRSPSNIRDQQTQHIECACVCVAALGGYLYTARLSCRICVHQSERAHFKLLEFARHSFFCFRDITHLHTFIDFIVSILLGLSKLSLLSANGPCEMVMAKVETNVLLAMLLLKSRSCQRKHEELKAISQDQDCDLRSNKYKISMLYPVLTSNSNKSVATVKLHEQHQQVH